MAKKPVQEQSPRMVAVFLKIGIHEMNASGDRQFVDDMIDNWQAKVEDYEQRLRQGNGQDPA